MSGGCGGSVAFGNTLDRAICRGRGEVGQRLSGSNSGGLCVYERGCLLSVGLWAVGFDV